MDRADWLMRYSAIREAGNRMAAPAPTMYRIQLGKELQNLRDQAGKSREDVAAHLGWYLAKVGKVELGTATVSAAEVESLVTFLGADTETAQRLRQLGKDARKRGTYGKVSDWARTYVGMEGDAAEIHLFGEELVPGLLQTDGYARAVTQASVLARAADIDHLVSSRVQRRNKLYGDEPPQLSVIISEAVLRRQVGGPTVAQEQLRLLREIADLEHVALQVLPFTVGAHAAMGTSFTILTLRDNAKRTVYLEDITNADYLDRPHHLGTYNLVFERLRMDALGLAESMIMLERAIEDLGTGR